MKRSFIIILFLFLITTGLLPAASIVSVDSTVTPDRARAGDTLTYTVTVHGTQLESLSVDLPEQREYYPENETAAKNSVKSGDAKQAQETDPVPLYMVRSAEKTISADGSLTVKILIAYLRTGTYTLPGIRMTGDDGVAMGYRIPNVTIIETNREGKFEEIEGPLEPPADYTKMIITALITILLCVLAGIGIYFLYKYMRKRIKSVTPEIQITPYEQFVIDLEKLKPDELIASGEVRQYAFGMSITFRMFLYARFGFDAAEMTTDEIRRNLKKFMPAHLYAAYSDEIMRCMDLWDISKFAEFTPSREILAENLRSVKVLAEKVSAQEGSNVAPGV